jgi:hypothetical protein
MELKAAPLQDRGAVGRQLFLLIRRGGRLFILVIAALDFSGVVVDQLVHLGDQGLVGFGIAPLEGEYLFAFGPGGEMGKRGGGKV